MNSDGYAELHALSNFSFLHGASHPGELVAQAHALDYRALAITDECSMAGVVRAHEALRELAAQSDDKTAFKLIIGSQFRTACGLKLCSGSLATCLSTALRAHHHRPSTLPQRQLPSDTLRF